MDGTDVSELFTGGIPLTYKRNDFIIRAEDTPSGVYMVQSGVVKAFSLSSKGEVSIHLLYGAGELFPLVWAITGQLKDIHFQAMNDVVVLRISREEFLDKITSDRGHMLQILQYIGQYIAVYSERVQNLAYQYASERVAYRLLFLASRFGIAEGHEIVIPLTLTHDDIAQSTNLSRRTVSRELDRFERNNLITIRNRSIVILDVAILHKVLSKTIVNNSWLPMLSDTVLL